METIGHERCTSLCDPDKIAAATLRRPRAKIKPSDERSRAARRIGNTARQP
jgi:hypothetical protein